MFLNRGNQMIELVIGGDPEFDTARAAPDPAGERMAGCGHVEQHAGFVADHPGIVSGGNDVRVARGQLEFLTIVEADLQTARQHKTDVGDLAGLRPDHRLHVRRPAPAWLEGCLRHGGAGQVGHRQHAMLEGALVVGGGEIADAHRLWVVHGVGLVVHCVLPNVEVLMCHSWFGGRTDHHIGRTT
jgi:hypothetical protein